MLSSVAGIPLGRVDDLFYKVMGDAVNCLALPGFFSLFLISFGTSFFLAVDC